MNATSIALIYHINFNHLSLTHKQRSRYLSDYLGLILKSLKVPVSISISGEDLLLLKFYNPITYNTLTHHPLIQFLLSPYSHLVSSIFPNYYIENISLGKKLIYKLLADQKITQIGYPSEVEIPPASLFADITKIWPGIILGESRINVAGFEKNHFPGHFQIKQQNNNLKVYLSRRHFRYRQSFHQFLLGYTSAKEVIHSLLADYQQYSFDGSTLNCRIDLEAVLLNETNGDDHSLKRFALLQNEFSASSIKFCYVGLDKSVISYELESISHDPQEDKKWQNLSLQKRVNKIDYLSLNPRQKIIFHTLLCSDYYCSNNPDLILHNSEDNIVKIVKGREYRNPEIRQKLKLFRESINNWDTLNIKQPKLHQYMLNYQSAIIESINLL